MSVLWRTCHDDTASAERRRVKPAAGHSGSAPFSPLGPCSRRNEVASWQEFLPLSALPKTRRVQQDSGTGREKPDGCENWPLTIAVLGVEGAPPSRGGRGWGVGPGTTTRLPRTRLHARIDQRLQRVGRTVPGRHHGRSPCGRPQARRSGTARPTRSDLGSGQCRVGGARCSDAVRNKHLCEEHAPPPHPPQPGPGPTPYLLPPSRAQSMERPLLTSPARQPPEPSTCS